MKFSIVIPVYQEGTVIRSVLMEMDEVISRHPQFQGKVAIVVSEDGSTDNTRAEVDLAAEMASTQIVLLQPAESRLGYSRAMQRGILEAPTEMICTMDSDGQCDVADCIKLLQELDATRKTVISGYRDPRNDSANRIFYSRLFGLVFRALFRVRLTDPSCPVVAFRRSELKNLLESDSHLKYGYWWEFQARVSRQDMKVVQVPIRHKERAGGATQVYQLRRLPRIISTHLVGLVRLKFEIS